jgi:hypothetical protein
VVGVVKGSLPALNKRAEIGRDNGKVRRNLLHRRNKRRHGLAFLRGIFQDGMMIASRRN